MNWTTVGYGDRAVDLSAYVSPSYKKQYSEYSSRNVNQADFQLHHAAMEIMRRYSYTSITPPYFRIRNSSAQIEFHNEGVRILVVYIYPTDKILMNKVRTMPFEVETVESNMFSLGSEMIWQTSDWLLGLEGLR